MGDRRRLKEYIDSKGTNVRKIPVEQKLHPKSISRVCGRNPCKTIAPPATTQYSPSGKYCIIPILVQQHSVLRIMVYDEGDKSAIQVVNAIDKIMTEGFSKTVNGV